MVNSMSSLETKFVGSVRSKYYGSFEKPIPNWVKCSSSVNTWQISSSFIISIDIRSVNEILGLS